VAAIRKELQLSVSPLIADFDGLDERQAFCLVQDQPERIRQIFISAGRVEILWRLAQDERFHAVQFLTYKNPQLRIDAGYDLSIPEAIPASIHLSGNATRRHAVITGPNGGGKSSALRAVLQSVLLGHAYGIAPATRAEMPRFHWIASGLQLRDTPGVLSMFETEVFFAARTLAAQVGPGLVLFDELFHSTNPPDADRTAELFLRSLWDRTDVFSVVSTHNFGLIERAPASVLPLCCPAKELPNGDIEYSFLLQPGISKVSSVKKVWQRFGLSGIGATAAAPAAPENPTGQQEAK
jgi:DNA mismatch repair ATPase MutS